jgi:UDP-N-acetylmuramyl pentapeptide phosphotransferase/UDP-N-acetylglucosamine-1-phosphate transferase
MTGSDAVELLLTALVSGFASAALIVAILPLLKRYALARPNVRSSHVAPTPQGAGIAVVAATVVVAAVALAATSGIRPLVGSLFVPTIAIAMLGAVDDLRPVPVLPRLAAQIVAVAAVLTFLPVDARALPLLPLPAERALELLAGLWFVNLVNFMDGIDWITVAEVVPITAALLLLACLKHVSPPAGIVAAALGGATLGFAPFNKPVARVFLGDVGSLPIGLMLGWCLLDLAAHAGVAAALLLPLYYLADATLTLLRRLSRREQVWVAHRSHCYQRATDNGWSVLRIVGNVFALNVLLAVLAIMSAMVASYWLHAAALAAGAVAVALVLARFVRPAPR